MSENAGSSGWVSDSGIAEEEIRDEVSRILASPIFVQSDRLGRFLRYTVETALAGEEKTLKEYRIGVEVYDRRPPYHPSSDSIVRSEARRLRRKLKEYYESNGVGDPVFVYFRPGSYVPVFRRGESQKGIASATERAFRELLESDAVAKAVEISCVSRDGNLQIVFEGTIRVSYLREKPAIAVGIGTWPKRSKRIPFKRVVGISGAKAN